MRFSQRIILLMIFWLFLVALGFYRYIRFIDQNQSGKILKFDQNISEWLRAELQYQIVLDEKRRVNVKFLVKI